MITDYLYEFFYEIFYTFALDMHLAPEYITTCASAVICTLPVYFLLKFLTNTKTANAVYIALQVAFFALQAYSINGGIL